MTLKQLRNKTTAMELKEEEEALFRLFKLLYQEKKRTKHE